MKIGELARQSGLATTALRYYEKAGLLPRSRRTSSGYRTYDGDVVSRLAFIRAAQAVGLTVAEIREIVGIRDAGMAPCAHVLELLDRRRAEVQSRIRELQQLERDLSRLSEHGAGVDPSECDPAGVCKVIPSKPRGGGRSAGGRSIAAGRAGSRSIFPH
jgi:DNA-binding transcriptional MerR regulator